MSRAEREGSPLLGLDIGTSRIVVGRNTGEEYEYEAQLNAFVSLPNSRLGQSLLQQETVFHEIDGSEIIVAGNDAQKYAEMFHSETRRPMQNGVLNPNEPRSLAVVRSIIRRLVGRAATEGQKIFFSVPSPALEGPGSIAYHEASCRQVLTELGYQAKPIEEGLAVVLGELASSNYTGIGISCGGGLCNVCLAVLSLPVVSFSVPKAGDFVDAQAAFATGELITRLRVQKEQRLQLNGLSSDRIQNAFVVYYEEMVRTLVEALRSVLSSAKFRPKLDRPIPLVLSGGSAMPRGFLPLFEEVLRSGDFPLQLSEVRVSADPLHSTVRGAMLAALC